jgi:DHA1 family tetracycline resistance protein-like MFS transporter
MGCCPTSRRSGRGTALNVDHVSPHEQGALMGVTTALGSLMSLLGPLWAGAVYDGVMPGAPYWMGAVVFVVAALVLTRPTSWRRIRWSS